MSEARPCCRERLGGHCQKRQSLRLAPGVHSQHSATGEAGTHSGGVHAAYAVTESQTPLL